MCAPCVTVIVCVCVCVQIDPSILQQTLQSGVLSIDSSLTSHTNAHLLTTDATGHANVVIQNPGVTIGNLTEQEHTGLALLPLIHANQVYSRVHIVSPLDK